jgi:hypothetical protein
MTNKERYLKAVVGTNSASGVISNCKFCIISKHYNNAFNCPPCPFADEYQCMGCEDARDILDSVYYWPSRRKYLNMRVIKCLEQYPDEQFTKRGWKYFEELHSLIKEIRDE